MSLYVNHGYSFPRYMDYRSPEPEGICNTCITKPCTYHATCYVTQTCSKTQDDIHDH